MNVKKTGSATDPLWYKDAIIYELHVRAFADSNGDGIGDFGGLMGKLDYLQDLGVTCIWLLPFFPSPLRDDGYDIANYVDVNPSYGTLDDFRKFMDAAHLRGMQVMIELVINHTSDQHPWFKAARLAPPGSPEREMYVWSETDKLYDGVRIIFTDTEKSNWTWDDQAKAFYWHRFFSHQPDLNFDNPRVMEEVLTAMRFWLDMGVDALRLDAIPYLIERDGTNCENVPETHVKIKEIRAVIDNEYGNRTILAEANMWPADVRPYFGDGDECHMAFHFPLMPRIYMALRQEDRLPITDIMAQTPEIPANCQWGLFLRNHDELTLEMVTDDERDYMNLAYAADARMRINVGIRRRLAPLVDNNRRRIELLNSLLLSFPGTPIMYYGDEIGMGDNIYLGDRNGVRTPMQWNSDRNAGFSRCDPARLYFPVVMDPIYGYQVVNVEAQLSDQSSLLHWTRNMIALRKLFQVFGRGTLTFLNPDNRKILAYLRKLQREDGSTEIVLCVANLSRFAQPCSLDLMEYEGMMPVEMLGYVPFPKIEAAPYAVTLSPYSFLWLELQAAPTADAATDMSPEAAVLATVESETHAEAAPLLDLATATWAELLTGATLASIEAALPAYLLRQRWFGAKSRIVQSIEILDWAELPGTGTLPVALFYLGIGYTDGETHTYQLPMALSAGPEADEVQTTAPNSILLKLATAEGPALLYDAVTRDDLRQSLLGLIEANGALPMRDPATIAPAIAAPVSLSAQPGEAVPPPTSAKIEAPKPAGSIAGRKSDAFAALRGTGALASRTGSVEQSNTSLIYNSDAAGANSDAAGAAGKLIMKLFRRLQPGENPDTEIGRFLTDVAHYPHIAPFLGEIDMTGPDGEPTTLAMLQGLVSNEGDGWAWFLEQLARFYETVASVSGPSDLGCPASLLNDAKISAEAMAHAATSVEAAALLGRRTGEMHLALATPTADPAFAAEAFTHEDLDLDARRIDIQITSTLEALKRGLAQLKDLTADAAALLLSRRIELYARAHAITGTDTGAAESGMRTRIHGDYHLGQVLRTPDQDYVILDFEGEPARTLEERRRKQSPLKDVAGMLRSFSYAAYSGLDAYTQAHPAESRSAEPWAKLWQNAVSTAFLRAWWETVATKPGLVPAAPRAQALLNAYLLEKALYELLYELNNRPDWVRIPLAGILALEK